MAKHFQIINSYLFRRMTGVGGRPEVIIEGSDSMNGPWKEYHFMYKPGNMSESPKFVLPHQPRLDWQMWFAALGSYGHNPWFISLLYRILESKTSYFSFLEKCLQMSFIVELSKCLILLIIERLY